MHSLIFTRIFRKSHLFLCHYMLIWWVVLNANEHIADYTYRHKHVCVYVVLMYITCVM